VSDGGSTRSGTGTAGAIGTTLGTAVRVLRGESPKYARGLFAGAGAFSKAVGHVLHMLWLEVTGFVFLCFSIIGGFALYREYPGLRAGNVSQGRFGVTLLFSLMFVYFGLNSFWRARHKKK